MTIEIDGAMGEGGGQILRTALALSIYTSKPFRITQIRAKRRKPGLLPQHLTAVRAAATISKACTKGDQLRSTTLTFTPNPVQAGDYHFATGTAGSATLVLQTVLYPLLFAQGQSRLTLEGGTHNSHAPPFDFLAAAFLPLLQRMGFQVHIKLQRYGFYPKGGGQLAVTITPTQSHHGLQLTTRGSVKMCQATALIAQLPTTIAQRELQQVTQQLNDLKIQSAVQVLSTSQGPGNVLLLKIQSDTVTELFAGFGQRGVSAEQVATDVVRVARRYLTAEVAVGEYLADQLLLPLALVGQGTFTTLKPSQHTLTNKAVIEQFLPCTIKLVTYQPDQWMIQVSTPAIFAH